ncbi:hypothetical protein PRIPAC_83735, partial [Pristionchus pacificus]|uniref:MATH domain-containing protein n=1 Tax=Pristionchus pacificus TaxID=54126 RepID=A0A2A6CCM7_PRIPA
NCYFFNGFVWTYSLKCLHDVSLMLQNGSRSRPICQESPTYTAKGLPWALRVVMECSDRTNYENKLAIYVKCNWESENREWNCDYSASYTLVNRDADASFSNSILNRVLNFDHSLRGFHSFVKLTHLINEEKGFVTDGSITIEVKITINKITGVEYVAK